MAKRFTLTEKWEKKKFRNYSPEAKLLLLYIFDKCDIAGFWEIDLNQAKFSIGFSTDLNTLMKELANSYITVSKELIWVKNFIIYQGNWPLKKDAPAHKGICRILLSHNSFVQKTLEHMEEKTGLTVTKELLNSLSISKGISISKSIFQEPTVSEIQDYCKEKNISIDAEDFIQFYGSKNWMVGKNKMKDWRLAVCRATKWEINKQKQPVVKTEPAKSATCVVCNKAARDYRYDDKRRPIFLCSACIKAIGGFQWGQTPKAELERRVEQGKAKQADHLRTTPKEPSHETVTNDKRNAAVDKLITDTAKRMGVGK